MASSPEVGGGGGRGEVSDDKERRLIIIGKTGNGKSSLGNLLLGKPHFPVRSGSASMTVSASSGSAHFRDWKIKVLDTPDLRDMNEDEAQREVSTWKALMSPGEHAILLAVRCDRSYTSEEHEMFLRLKTLWGGNSLTRRLVVIFTFGDSLTGDLSEGLKGASTELKNVLEDASHRYLLFNDRDTPQGKEEQTLRLLQMVDQLDAEVLEEERRLLTGIQVCPMGPVDPPGS